MATIESYPTKSGKRYRVRYRTPDHRQTDKRGFRTKRDAEAFAATVEVEILRGEYVAPAAGRVTVAQLADTWLAGKVNLSPSTRARYESAISVHILPAFGTRAVSEVTPELLRRWVSQMSQTSSPATVRKTVTVVHQILDEAVRDRRLSMNPAIGLDLPKVEHAEMRFLTPQQVAELANAAGSHDVLVYTLAYCGLRLGEAAALRVADVLLDKQMIRIHRSVTMVDGKMVETAPKSNRARDVPVPRFLAGLLRAHLEGRPDTALVFPDSRGGYMRGNNMRRRWWDRAVRASGCPHGLHPHELRHTFASLAISSGVPIKALQAALGHSSAALTLDRYGHLYETDYASIGDRMDALHHQPLRAV